MQDVHRFGGILVGTFVTIHVVSVAIDSYLPFSILSLAVPLVGRLPACLDELSGSSPPSCSALAVA